MYGTNIAYALSLEKLGISDECQISFEEGGQNETGNKIFHLHNRFDSVVH